MLRTTVSVALLAMASIGAVMAAQAGQRDVVLTRSGSIMGLGRQPSGVREFLGIPYAQAPVGPLRWAAPQPLPRWAGVRAALSFAPRCMQQPVFSDMVFRSAGISEDCLYLNVWTPARSSHDRLSVLVYLHGGGLIAGDGSELRYDGESMAHDGVVVVTLNYRLGVFGFMAHPELTQASAGHGSGNYGLLDQLAALQWVHDNVAAFGGDASRITIAGESAGSFSVSALMVSPLSRGLIAGAIGESGSLLGTRPVAALADAEQNGLRLATAARARSLADLRELPAAELLALASKPMQIESRSATIEFGATVDGHFLPRSPAELYAAGQQAQVPLLAGVNTGEGQPAAILAEAAPTVAAYRAALKRDFAGQADAFFNAYPAASDGESVLVAAQALAGDLFISYSTRRWLKLATRSGSSPTYCYVFSQPRPALTAKAEAAAVAAAAAAGRNYVPDRPRGAVHSAEIEYALGNLRSNAVFAWTDEDYRVSQLMRGYFLNFVKSGDPNGAGLPNWPQYRNGLHLNIGAPARAEPDDTGARDEFLDRMFAAESHH